MAEQAWFVFYKIEKCGFYSRGENTPIFSNIRECLTSLKEWAHSKQSLINTCTYKPKVDDEYQRTFFLEQYTDPKTGDIFFSTWNEVPNNSGKVYALSAMSAVGDHTRMLEKDFSSLDAIPGIVSYFWFIPKKNIFVNVKFSHSMKGKKNLEKYLINYYQYHSQYVRKNQDGTIDGYTDGTQNTASIRPAFQATQYKLNGVRSYLHQHIQEISFFIRKEHLSYRKPDQRDWLEKVFSGLIKSSPFGEQEEKNINLRIDYKPTSSELDEIIDSVDTDENLQGKDIGFQLTDGRKIYLNGLNVNQEHTLPINRDPNQIIKLPLLAEKICEMREGLLESLKKRPDEDEHE